MASTPPPPSPSALRVPTAPRHGAGYDSFEPYATRYSARLASQRASRSKETSVTNCPSSPSKVRSKASPRKYQKVEEATISPPGSYSKSRDIVQTSHASTSKTRASDVRYNEPNSQLSHPQFSATRSGTNALPTPAKTPSKKKVTTDLSSTARTLFPPTAKMSKPKVPHSLDPFEDPFNATTGRESIKIHTDSRDRIPMPQSTPSMQNPFSGDFDSSIRDRFTGGSDSTTDYSTRIDDPMFCPTRELFRLDRDDQLTYNFRGKRITKHFDEEEDEEDDPSDLGLFAGREHLLPDSSVLQNIKPLRRKDVVPRLLWPEGGGPIPAPRKLAETKPADESIAEDEATDHEDLMDDSKARAINSPQPELPPSPRAIRKLRSSARYDHDNDESPTANKGTGSNQKRTPFNNWLRKKRSTEEQPAVTPTKREAEDEGGSLPGPKRTRATTRSTQSA
ncbi:hypothetical protein N7490_004614 [Penicillium lividum]|nr:hypothetical protein N7490_004614 [Penicillium lividum]